MARPSISITVDSKSLGDKIFGQSTMKRIHQNIGDIFVQITRESMGVGKPNRPSPWAPLSKRYAKRVRPPVPTLLRTGTLQNSIKNFASPDYAHIFSGCQYAATHQFGRGPIPARQFFPMFGVSGGFQLTPYAQIRIEAEIFRTVLGLVF